MANLRIARVSASILAATPPAVTAAASTPATQFYLFHNWMSESILETGFSTDVTAASSSVAEERRALIDRPMKTQSCVFTNLTRSEASRALFLLMRAAEAPTLVPIYSSISRMTAASSGALVSCDTRWRRLQPGMRVLLYDRSADLVEDAIILSMTHTTLTMTGAITGAFSEGSNVYPLMDAEVIQNASISMITDAISEVAVEFKELQGPTALPPLDLWFPSGRPTIFLLPLLDSDPNWANNVAVGVLQPGAISEFGRGTIARIRGSRPKLLFQFVLTALSREEAWDHLRFFDACQGRLRPFWVLNPHVVFTPVADVQTTHADVLAMTQDDFEIAVGDFIDNVLIEEFDGTLSAANVSSVADVAGVTRISFSLSLPGTIAQADIKRITSLHKCRFNTDFMREQWRTDEICDLEFQCIEVLDEAARTITNLADSVAVGGLEAVGSKGGPFSWISASRNVYKTATALADPGSPSGDGDEFLKTFDVREPNTTTLLPFMVNTFPAGNILLHKLADFSVGFGRLCAHYPAGNVEYQKLDSTAGIDDTWFDNTDGITMFVVVNDVQNTLDIFEQVGVLEWTEGYCQLFETLNVVDVNLHITYATQTVADTESAIFALRWDPGVSAEVWRGGASLGTPTTQVTTLPTGGGDLRMTGDDAKVFEFLLYKEALTDADMNIVGNLLESTFNSIWTDI